ncbi:MAG: ABC transporter ATP-binding protein [Roseiflexaceae bacterium]
MPVAYLRKFFSYYRPYRRLLAIDLGCALIMAVTTLLLPFCISIITKDILPAQAPDMINQIALIGAGMIGLVAINATCSIFVDYQGHMMGSLMERDMRNELFAHYQQLSYRFYDQHHTGPLMSRLTNDLFSLSELYHHGPEDVAIAILKAIGVFILLFSIDTQLTLIILLFLPMMAAYAFYFNRKMNKALYESNVRIGEVNSQVEDTLSGIRVVQSFANEALEQQKFIITNERFVQSRRDGYRSEAYFYGGMLVFSELLTILIILFGSIAMLQRSLELADLLTYILCLGILIDPIQRLVNFARLYQEGLTGFRRFMELLEQQPEIVDRPEAQALTTVGGSIEFRQVSFRYHDQHDLVLKNLSLALPAGSFTAIVGPSGAGKTTMCALIPRFYEVSTGNILIDGHDIRDIQLAALRRAIGVVQQDVYLFTGTVAENIRYAQPDASDEAVIAAAKQANAHEFIMALPQGYNTDIGQRGVKLSGGQKQRLSIARVFLKNPAIIIFDEATSALDSESEQAVQTALERLAYQRTTLVIAHRLSTIRHAERIVVLTNQGIAEQGTHSELMRQQGVYAKLYTTAADRFEDVAVRF